MVGAGAIITQALAGESTQENRARVFEQRFPLVGIGAGHLQVLGRDAVADVASLLHAAGVDQRTTAVERGQDDALAWHLGQEFVDGCLHRIDVSRIGAQQYALRQFVVLGLAEQIHGHPIGRR